MAVNSAWRYQSLAYPADSAVLFEPFADEPWALFLDSGGLDRFDLISADPSLTLVTRGEISCLRERDGMQCSTASPFALLRELLGTPQARPTEQPLPGCLIGFFGYDLARRLEHLPDRHGNDDGFPDLAFGRYDWLLVVDHQERQAYLCGHPDLDDDRWQALLNRLAQPATATQRQPLSACGPVLTEPGWQAYAHAFSRLQAYIQDGDCYQVNLARRFDAQVQGDAWQAYRQLRQDSPAPFGAYVNLPDGQILCNSPESFLQVRAGRVTTSPIKGTRPRHADTDRDQAVRRELLHSSKDRAENLMIVDLLRNDLGRSCRFGSIQVEQLFRLASFATVHHLITDISGQLQAGLDALDLLQGCFPGGSITGAPKLRAMQIIEELEPARRGPYCGSLAYLGPDGSLRSNILIRTLLRQGERAWFWAGGGIVADSDAAAEFAETEQKARALRRLLEKFDD